MPIATIEYTQINQLPPIRQLTIKPVENPHELQERIITKSCPYCRLIEFCTKPRIEENRITATFPANELQPECASQFTTRIILYLDNIWLSYQISNGTNCLINDSE